MEFKELPKNIRTWPNEEMPLITEKLGVTVPVIPLKVILNEGNRRVMKDCDDKILRWVLVDVGRSNRCFGDFIYIYNAYFLRSLNDIDNSFRASIHENGHALHHSLEEIGKQMTGEIGFCQEVEEGSQELLSETERGREHWSKKFFAEGFAEWITTATMVRARKLRVTPLRAHMGEVAARIQQSRKDFKGATTVQFMYDLGHLFVFKAMCYLTEANHLGIPEALQILAMTPPKKVNYFREAIAEEYFADLKAMIERWKTLHQ